MNLQGSRSCAQSELKYATIYLLLSLLYAIWYLQVLSKYL